MLNVMFAWYIIGSPVNLWCKFCLLDTKLGNAAYVRDLSSKKEEKM